MKRRRWKQKKKKGRKKRFHPAKAFLRRRPWLVLIFVRDNGGREGEREEGKYSIIVATKRLPLLLSATLYNNILSFPKGPSSIPFFLRDLLSLTVKTYKLAKISVLEMTERFFFFFSYFFPFSFSLKNSSFYPLFKNVT